MPIYQVYNQQQSMNNEWLLGEYEEEYQRKKNLPTENLKEVTLQRKEEESTKRKDQKLQIESLDDKMQKSQLENSGHIFQSLEKQDDGKYMKQVIGEDKKGEQDEKQIKNSLEDLSQYQRDNFEANLIDIQEKEENEKKIQKTISKLTSDIEAKNKNIRQDIIVIESHDSLESNNNRRNQILSQIEKYKKKLQPLTLKKNISKSTKERQSINSFQRYQEYMSKKKVQQTEKLGLLTKKLQKREKKEEKRPFQKQKVFSLRKLKKVSFFSSDELKKIEDDYLQRVKARFNSENAGKVIDPLKKQTKVPKFLKMHEKSDRQKKYIEKIIMNYKMKCQYESPLKKEEKLIFSDEKKDIDREKESSLLSEEAQMKRVSDSIEEKLRIEQ